MVLSKRERSVGIATVAIIGSFVLYQYIFTPLIDKKNTLDGDIATASLNLSSDLRLIKSGRDADRKWLDMASGALRKDASEAESQVLNSVREWAQEAGMNLSQITPGPKEKEKDFYKMTFRGIGNTGMAQISKLLWRVRTANMPVAVTDLQISSRKDGTDDLSLQMGFSTIYLVPESERPRTPTASPKEAP